MHRPRPVASRPLKQTLREETVDIRGRKVVVAVSVSQRCRNISLRLDEKNGQVQLVLPRFVSRAEGLRFVREKARWVLRQIDSLPPRVPFADGAQLPLMGQDHTIRHRPDSRGVVWRQGAEIHVAGQAEHLPRRVGDWLRREARQEILRRADHYALQIGARYHQVALRDTRSRWGSCTEDGHLSFSWRLIFAPEFVLDYVVAHEVAHLVELNHSLRFWRLVELICADTGRARSWLKQNGLSLHRYG